MIFNYGGFDRVEELCVETVSDVVEEPGIHQESIRPIGEKEAAAGDWLDLVLNSNRRGEAAEEDATGLELVPDMRQHGFEMGVVMGEMEDGAGDDEVEGTVRERHRLDGLAVEVLWRKVGDRLGLLIDGAHIVALVDKVADVAALAAAGVKDFHARLDATTEHLIDQVDVGIA